MEPITPGRTAYEGYFKKCGGKSLISGADLPTWNMQSEAIRESWEAAALAVLDDHGRRQSIKRNAASIAAGVIVCESTAFNVAVTRDQDQIAAVAVRIATRIEALVDNGG